MQPYGAKDIALSWNLVVAAAGMVLGLRFRAGALIAATLVVVILSLALRVRFHGFGWSPLWHTLTSVIVLQLCYLVGLAVAAFWRHLRGT
jgi:hypothetical protein